MSQGSMSMSDNFLNLIYDNLESKKTILEFGSGDGTLKLLERGYKVYSIEENKNFYGVHHNNYLLAEIVDGWYHVSKVFNFLKDKKWDAILIDGPAYGERKNMYEILGEDFFKKSIIFIDDIERPSDRELFNILKKDRSYKDFNYYGMII